MSMWGDHERSSSSDCTSVEAVEELTWCMYQTGRVEVGDKDEDGEESKRFEVEFNGDFRRKPIVFVCPEGEVGKDYADVFGTTVIEDTVSESGFHVNIGRMAKGECHGWGQELQLNWFAVDSNSPACQAQVVDVGRKDDEDAESISVTIRFKQPFPEGVKPIIYASCYGEDYPDTFAVCVQRVSRKRCTLNICRGIGGGWGQNLKVSLLATTSFPAYQVDVGTGEEERDQSFPDRGYPGKPSARRPLILTMAQHEHGSDLGDAFICSPANVTKEDFQLNVQRGNMHCHDWGQELRAQVILIP